MPGIKTETCQSFSSFQIVLKNLPSFMCLFPLSYLSSRCRRCFYPCRCHLYIFFNTTFQSMQIVKSHTSTAVPRRSKHIMHCSAFRSAHLSPFFDVVFATVSQKTCILPLVLKVLAIARKKRPRKGNHC